LAGTQHLNDLAFIPQIKLFPNPANDNIFFMMDDLLKLHAIKLEIMNLQGQIISTETYQAGTLNNISTSNLKSGVYICKLSNGLFVSTSKFIVQH
jgi:hypothetical protein